MYICVCGCFLNAIVLYKSLVLLQVKEFLFVKLPPASFFIFILSFFLSFFFSFLFFSFPFLSFLFFSSLLFSLFFFFFFAFLLASFLPSFFYLSSSNMRRCGQCFSVEIFKYAAIWITRVGINLPIILNLFK